MVTRKKGSKWTPEEVSILMELYPTQGWRAVNARLPHRTAETIRAVAKKSGAMSRRYVSKHAATATDSPCPLPAMDLIQQLECVRFRRWTGPVDRSRALAWRLSA